MFKHDCLYDFKLTVTFHWTFYEAYAQSLFRRIYQNLMRIIHVHVWSPTTAFEADTNDSEIALT